MAPDLLAEIRADMDVAAADIVERMVDARARRYLSRPILLEAVQLGLSTASPAALIARATSLLEMLHRGERPARFGFGGENTEISLLAAKRVGEWLLAEECHDDRQRAAVLA